MSPVRTERVSAPVRRVLAVGLLVVFVLVYVFWVVLPSFRWAAKAIDDLADVRFELDRATRAQPANPRNQAELVESTYRELSGQLVAGPKDTDAAGALQAHVSQSLAAQGMVAEIMAARAPTAQGPLRRLSLDWRGTATETALVRALAALELGRPLMHVERLSVQRRSGTDMPGGMANDEARLVVDMRIVAYWTALSELAGKPPLATAHAPAQQTVPR